MVPKVPTRSPKLLQNGTKIMSERATVDPYETCAGIVELHVPLSPEGVKIGPGIGSHKKSIKSELFCAFLLNTVQKCQKWGAKWEAKSTSKSSKVWSWGALGTHLGPKVPQAPPGGPFSSKIGDFKLIFWCFRDLFLISGLMISVYILKQLWHHV